MADSIEESNQVPENVQEEIQSPCIGVCSMDDLTGYCYGCYRTIEEIKDWSDMRQPEHKKLLAELDARQNQVINFD